LEEEESWETKFLEFLNKIDKKYLENSEKIPERSRVRREIDATKDKIIIFAKK
jgi:hypothetical protein